MTSGPTWILHVDDSPSARLLTGQLLERAGFRAVGAATGEEALRLVQLNPGLVLLDLELPDISGFEVCRRIKEKPATGSIPVLHLTAALIDPSYWVSSLEGGADGYLRQPVDGAVLVATIRALLRARRAEAEVRQAAYEWQSTFEALGVGICLLGPDGEIARRNPAAQSGCFSPQVSEFFERVKGNLRRETGEVQAGGRWLAVTVDPILCGPGGFGGAVAAFYDISDRKSMEHDLASFAYVASHDLQEPLRMVKSYLQLLARRYQEQLDEPAGEFIRYAVDGAERMSNLIQDLLAYSRADGRTLELSPMETGAALEVALANLQVAIGESGAEIERGPLPAVMGDLRQLTQLFQNLVSNALKFRGEAPPRVRIGAQRVGDAYHFFVQDNGIGIAPENRERIFEMFQRCESRSQYPGTGLGLAIAKRVVDNHGGRIWVESEPGHGSIFRFTIPAS